MTSSVNLDNDNNIDDTTPLLDDGKDEKSEKMIKLLMVERANSSAKWVVFGLLFMNTIALYQCLLSISAVQLSLMKLYGWNSSQYAVLVYIVLGISIPSSIVAPYLIQRYSLGSVQLLSFILLTVGQFLICVGVRCYDDSAKTSYALVIMGRVLIGMSGGANEVTILSNLYLWFNETELMGLISAVIFSAIEIGNIIARYGETPLVNEYDDLALAFIYGVILGVVSIFGQLFLMYYDNQFKKRVQIEKGIDTSGKFKVKRDYTEILSLFTVREWLLSGVAILQVGMVMVFYSQMTLPVVEKYKVSENYSNIMLSTTSLVVIISTPCVGGLMALNKNIAVALSGVTIQVLGLALYIFIPREDSSVLSGWFSIALFGVGFPIVSAGVSAEFFASVPPDLITVASAMMTIGYFAFGAILSAIFGALADTYNTDTAVGLLLAGGLAMAVMTFAIFFTKEPKIRYGPSGKKIEPETEVIV